MKIEDVQLIQIDSTSYCNLSCPQCGRINPANGNLSVDITLKHIDPDVIFKNLEFEKMPKLKSIGFLGDFGDAIMHPKFESMVKTCLALPQKPYVFLGTNGEVHTPSWWARLGAELKDEKFFVEFCVDGTANTNKIYRVGSRYDLLIANIKAFVEAGGKAAQKTIIFKHNEDEIDEIKRIAESLGIDTVTFIQNDTSRFVEDTTVKQIKEKYKPISGMDVFFKNEKVAFLEPTKFTQSELNAYDVRGSSYNLLQDFFTLDIVNNDACSNFSRGWIEITYDGTISPGCCHSGAHLMYNLNDYQYIKQIVKDFDKLNLNKYTLSQILSSGFVERLENALTSSRVPGVCQRMCGFQSDGTVEFTKRYQMHTVKL
jgi:MoaA/NifB/PqqE/SkfB family radical SAM enzyme